MFRIDPPSNSIPKWPSDRCTVPTSLTIGDEYTHCQSSTGVTLSVTIGEVTLRLEEHLRALSRDKRWFIFRTPGFVTRGHCLVANYSVRYERTVRTALFLTPERLLLATLWRKRSNRGHARIAYFKNVLCQWMA